MLSLVPAWRWENFGFGDNGIIFSYFYVSAGAKKSVVIRMKEGEGFPSTKSCVIFTTSSDCVKQMYELGAS